MPMLAFFLQKQKALQNITGVKLSPLSPPHNFKCFPKEIISGRQSNKYDLNQVVC